MVALPLLRPRRRRAAFLRLLVTAVVVAVPVLGLVPASGAPPLTPVQMHTVDLQPVAVRDGSGWHVATVISETPFAMLGADLAHEIDVQVRTADGEGGDWGPWQPLAHTHDEGPDADSPEVSRAGERTHPLFTGRADRVQIRSQTAELAAADIVLIDPFGMSRSPWRSTADALTTAWAGTPGRAAAATAEQPPIVTRAEWGADEGITRRTYAVDQVDRVFIHHTVGSNSYTQAQAPGVVRGVQAYHVNSNGWSDIGYNFLVDRFGTIYEGRAGGIERAVIGAQAGGFNTSSAGIALMGTFTSATPPAASIDAIERLAAWIADIHHFPPTGRSDALSRGSSRYPDGQVVTLDNISGHRDVSATSCPGDGTYPLLGGMRPRIDALVGDQIVDHLIDPRTSRVIRGDPDADSMTVTATMDPPGDWTVQAADPDGRVMMRTTGEGATATGTLPLDGAGWGLGDYTFTISSPGRRTATITASLTPPVIEGAAVDQDIVFAGADGAARQPLRFSAALWPEASWDLRVTGPDGEAVLETSGVGERLDHTLDAFDSAPGTHLWTMTAEDAREVRGSFLLRYDVLERVSSAEDPIDASVLASRSTFMDRSASRAVIARSDVFADALAGGPLAGEDGPLLLSSRDVLDERVSGELARVLGPGATIYVLGGSQAITPAVTDGLAEFGTVVRLAGASRVDTATKVAAQVIADSGATTAMIARAGPDGAAPWADALAGGAWGAQNGVPVLLTATSRLSEETARAIADLGITETIVLGGTQAISDRAMAELPGATRLAGADRHDTAALVATQLWGLDAPVTRVALANGIAEGAWAWALTAAPLAAKLDAPLLLSGAATLPASTAQTVAQLDVVGGVVVGPASLVGDDVRFAVGAAAAGH